MPLVRRSPLARFLTALLTGWLAIVMVEPVAVHPCPMHDGMGAMAGMAGMHGARAHDPAHGGGAHHAAAHGASHDGAPDRDRAPASHQCTCLGDCAVATMGALPAASVATLPAPRLTTAAAPLARDVEPLAGVARHRQPLATAPPVARA